MMMRKLLACLVALASMLQPTSAGPWSVPPAGYGYVPVSGCPAPKGPQIAHYDICADQMEVFRQGLIEARAQGKLLFVAFGATWCAWCAALQRVLPQVDAQTSMFHRIEIGTSTLVNGRVTPVPSGMAVLNEVLARNPDAEMRGWPFLAVVDPAEDAHVYTRNTADLTISGTGAAGIDAKRVADVLEAGHGQLRLGIAAAPEPRRGFLSRWYHWLAGVWN
jgi:thiol-disulfide isomerase/thioredoxin